MPGIFFLRDIALANFIDHPGQSLWWRVRQESVTNIENMSSGMLPPLFKNITCPLADKSLGSNQNLRIKVTLQADV